LLRPVPDERVVAWVRAQRQSSLFTTVITRGEMLFGVCLLPEGRRRQELLREVIAVFSDDMAERVLDFGSEAADAYAEIAATRRSQGRPVSQSDAMIAGIARSRGADLATRNVRDFESCGVTLINPWQ
ncbi:type II toxin-antitoxin system VapC family toxin, partial [Methyloversatilis sp.]|uniref:type II toxin-antitoxin system VapC family toxin n=1 Tax=Methyloversatilis sp. TaxID=2569862 RepID=UPI002736712E